MNANDTLAVRLLAIPGVTINVRPFSVAKALQIETLIAGLLAPLFTGGGLTADGLAASLKGASELPAVFAALAEIASVTVGEGAAYPRMSNAPLVSLADDIFARKPSAVLAFVAQALLWQFADFFDESGRADLLGVAERLNSILGSLG